MTSRSRLLILAGGLIAAVAFGRPPASRAAENSRSGGEKFSDYSLIVQRNIFNPSRSASFNKRDSDAPPPPAPDPETVDLLGTWLTDSQQAAFIEGSRSEYTGAPSVGETVGGWRVAAIAPDHVVLKKDDAQLLWPVGRRIERDGEDGWKLAGAAAPSAKTPGSSSSRAPSSSSSNNGGSSADDLLQRMRERRQREMQQ